MTKPDSAELISLLEGVTQIAVFAGRPILEVYEQGRVEVNVKADRSPVTEADMRAHRSIMAGLAALSPLPVLSEEGAEIPFETRRIWDAYWLVDPLDGTREFLSRNGEFTVNIALIVDHVPALGVVYAPATDILYAGAPGISAYRIGQGGAKTAIRITAPCAQPPRVVASRSHQNAETVEYLERLGPSRLVSIGSSLKFCRVAEGGADVYPRLAPTSEWDTAAGHAVLQAAGGRVVRTDGEPLRYNTRAGLLNPSFIAYGDGAVDWLAPLRRDLSAV